MQGVEQVDKSTHFGVFLPFCTVSYVCSINVFIFGEGILVNGCF